jgi:hypothetical protein
MSCGDDIGWSLYELWRRCKLLSAQACTEASIFRRIVVAVKAVRDTDTTERTAGRKGKVNALAIQTDGFAVYDCMAAIQE